MKAVVIGMPSFADTQKMPEASRCVPPAVDGKYVRIFVVRNKLL